MRLGIPRETRDGETRVAATPETVKKYVAAGHQVLFERDAGLAAHFDNASYEQAGAVLTDANEAFAAELVLKVRAPDANELAKMQKGAILFKMTPCYANVAN